VDIDSSFKKCEPRIAAKQAHTLFPDHAEPWNTLPRELTHTGLWGPIKFQALNGAHYNMVLVDDNTRHLVTEQAKTKHEACTQLQNYFTYIEQQFNFKPKKVRFDRGQEFLNQKLINWCAEKGIKIEATTPYSPSQNGVAERFNRYCRISTSYDDRS
jgi:IS30 family transposase